MDINVSVAILVNINKQVLLAQRPPPKSWEGWWEFPGGKIEKNETPVDALYREVYEEIGVKITQFTKWVTRKYSHEGNDIKLHFFKVYKWEGEIVSKEIRRERSKMLHILSDKKRRFFHDQFISKYRPVLFENIKNGKLLGHTDNYIQIQMEGGSELINSIHSVKLADNHGTVVDGKLS